MVPALPAENWDYSAVLVLGWQHAEIQPTYALVTPQKMFWHQLPPWASFGEVDWTLVLLCFAKFAPQKPIAPAIANMSCVMSNGMTAQTAAATSNPKLVASLGFARSFNPEETEVIIEAMMKRSVNENRSWVVT